MWQGLKNYILDSARMDGFKACWTPSLTDQA